MRGRPALAVVPSGRLQTVDYLRGLAALSVAWFHLTNTYAETSPVRLSGWYGYLGVEVFFVISGFIIPWSLRHTRIANIGAFAGYLSKRFTRVEIPYLLSILIVIGLWHASAAAPGFAGQPPLWSFAQVALHIVYLIPFSSLDWLSPVYWTLAYEFAFYIAIGALSYPLIVSRSPAPFLGVCLVLSAACLSGYVSAMFLFFVYGVAAYRRVHLEEAWPIFVALVAATLAVFVLSRSVAWPSIIAGTAATVIIICFAGYTLGGPVGAALRGLGAISYSLYLLHVPIGGRVVNIGKRFTSGDLGELAFSAAALGVSIACAWLFYLYVERPAHLAAQLRLTRA